MGCVQARVPGRQAQARRIRADARRTRRRADPADGAGLGRPAPAVQLRAGPVEPEGGLTMGLLGRLVLLPLAPVQGVLWLGETLQGIAEETMTDPAQLRQSLRDAEDAHQRGE